jgi:hypothetical protein
MKMKFKSKAAAMLLAAVGLLFGGCEDEETGDLYTLSGAVSDSVNITLSGKLGIVQFDLSKNPMPVSAINVFGEYLGDGTIGLTITNDETNVSYNILQGTMVGGKPEIDGQFSLEYSHSNHRARIVFWNGFDDRIVTLGRMYSASLTIQANDSFTTETFVVPARIGSLQVTPAEDSFEESPTP